MKGKKLILLVFAALAILSAKAQVTQDLYMNIPAGIDPENELVKLGYLDVTLYGADPTGSKISTDQINDAIRDARDYQLTCYFPSGTYLVDDTITGMMETRKLWSGATTEYSDKRYPITLVGARNPRPVIKLTGSGNGYDDPENPKPLIWLWSKNGVTKSTNPLDEQSNIFFNSTLKNFVIDIRGYAGAEGVRFSAAQGSTIEDVKVLADGAYAGFHGSVGQGGGTYNIEVIGGRHAMVYDDGWQQKFVMIAGASFIGQTEEIFKVKWMGLPMTITGFYIEKSEGPVFFNSPSKGGVSLVDGVIKYEDFSANNNLFTTLNSNLYIKTTYIKNGNKIGYTGDLDHSGWDLVEEYYWCNEKKGMNLINGISHTENNLTLDPDIDEGQVPSESEIKLKHTWDNNTFISIEDQKDADFVNVKDAVKMSLNGGPGPASGNAVDDDTEKLQWAIDHFDKVFIPKGRFVINKPLILRAHTQLLGAGKVYAIVRAGKNWDYTAGSSMIRTVEDANGTATVSFLMLETDYRYNKDLTRLEWHLGANSLVKDITVGIELRANEPIGEYHNMIEISGSTAGGKFYGLHGEYTFLLGLTSHPDYRHIFISGTEQPLKLYGCNAERAASKGQVEIVNSKNVDIYYLKSEAGYGKIGNETTTANVALAVRNSDNIHLYAYSGVTELEDDMAAVEFYNSTNISAVNMVKTNTDGSNEGWNYVKEICGGVEFKIPATKQVALFKRNKKCEVTSIESREEGIKVFPNPGNGVFNVLNYSSTPTLEVGVYDLAGKEIHKEKYSGREFTLNLSHFDSDTYLIKMNGNVYKVIKY